MLLTSLIKQNNWVGKSAILKFKTWHQKLWATKELYMLPDVGKLKALSYLISNLIIYSTHGKCVPIPQVLQNNKWTIKDVWSHFGKISLFWCCPDSPCTLTWPQLHFKTKAVCTARLDKNKVVACCLLWMTLALFVFWQWFACKLFILEVKEVIIS